MAAQAVGCAGVTDFPAEPSVSWRAAALLREVMSAHRDKDSSDYNGCDRSLCAWCEEADAILERLERL